MPPLSEVMVPLFGLILHLSICINAFLLAPSSFPTGNHHSKYNQQHQQSIATILSAKPSNNNINKVPTTNDEIIYYHYNLTILIPAYNEIDRIGETLCTYINYMKHQPVYQNYTTASSLDNQSTIITTGQCSILVIDDGSTDGMCQYIQDKTWLVPEKDGTSSHLRENCWSVNEHVSCISLPTNQGKGAAISRGMMELQCCATENEDDNNTCTRSIVLVADADGSGDISCLNDMIYSLECLLESTALTSTTLSENDLAIIVGKREYPQSKKSLLRSILSWGFRTCVSTLFIGTTTSNNNIGNTNTNALGVTDTQCGFKLMTTRTGKLLYHELNLKRWSHDVEVLYRASCLCNDVLIGECSVNWVDKDGSKLVSSGKDAVVMSAVMLVEIGKMRLLYAFGRWKMASRERESE